MRGIQRQTWMFGLVALALIILSVMFHACAGSFSQGAYNALNVSKSTYDATLTTAAELYKEGQITDADKEKIIEYGNAYMLVHNEAVEALLDYQAASGDQQAEAKEKYVAVADRLAEKLADLLAYYRKAKGGSQ